MTFGWGFATVPLPIFCFQFGTTIFSPKSDFPSIFGYFSPFLRFGSTSTTGIEFSYYKRGFISPENIWEDEKVNLVGRIL